MFFTVKFLCCSEPITKDSKEANEQPWARSTRDKSHVDQDVSNTMTTDRSQDSRHTTRKRPSKVLFMEFVQKQASCNFLLFALCDFVKSVITIQPINNIKSIRSTPDWRKSENRSALVSTSRIDFLKASAKRGRACRNSIASRKADGVNTHQVRTKTTYRANSKKVIRFCVVRACCGTLHVLWEQVGNNKTGL